MIAGIISVILIYLFVGFCKICRKRESLWIFLLVAVIMIPFNICMIRAVLSYIGEYREIRWFVKLGVCPLLYIVMFCIEEIICGIIGRLIWKRQYVLKWE